MSLICHQPKIYPNTINLAARPTAILPSEIIAKPGETIVLDGSASFENSVDGLINFTWFRIDQQSHMLFRLVTVFHLRQVLPYPMWNQNYCLHLWLPMIIN